MRTQLLILTSILAFCSIAYELLFANSLALLAGGTVWWHSLTIGIYIGGLGLGTFRAGKSLFPARDLIRIELILSIIGMSSAFVVYAASGLFETANSVAMAGYSYDFSSYIRLHTTLKILFFVVTQSLVFLVGYLSGFEVPLLIRLAGEDGKINRLLAANYIGTLIGTLAFAYILLPRLDVLYSALCVGAINLAVCLWIIKRYVNNISFRLKLGATFALCYLLLLGVNARSYEQAFLQVYYRAGNAFVEGGQASLSELWRKIKKEGDVVRMKSLYQYIDYFNISWKGRKEFILTLDTNFQFSSRNEAVYHESFVHIPILATKTVPENVLVLGAGDGLLVRELLKYPGVKKIKQVELDEEMVELAKTHPLISKLNEDSFADPRLELVIGDAFQYLRRANESYDAVFVDFPYPKNYNLAKLFSVEFYGFVRRVLKPEGFMVIDAPLRQKNNSKSRRNRQLLELEMAFLPKDKITNSMILSTVHSAGFKTFFPYVVGNESFLLATSRNEPLSYDLTKSSTEIIKNLDSSDLEKIGEQYFPYDIEQRYVNSVFHPILVD